MANDIVQPLSRTVWEAACRAFADHNYQQTWGYGQALAERRGATSEHVEIRSGVETIGLAAVRVKSLPVVGSGLAYVAGGPLVCREGLTDDVLGERFAKCLDALTDLYVSRRGLTLRFLPPIGDTAWNAARTKIFESAGFAPAERGIYRTLIVDVTRPIKDIRASLAQKWRNGLNGAEKKSLTMVSGTGIELFDEFCSLFSRFHDRKSFDIELGPDFYRAVQCNLSPEERFVVTLVKSESRAIAGHLGGVVGKTAVYLLGATDEEGLKNKAGYLLQWRAITSAKEAGLTNYDLGGIDPDGNPTVYHFKSGLSGTDVTAPGPFEFRSSSWRSALVSRAENLYRSIQRRRQTTPSKEGQPQR